MNEYQKIHTIYKRDPSGKRVLWGEYSLPEFEYLRDCRWTFTEKVDGTNIRVIWNGAGVEYKGRTEAAQIPATLIAVLRARFDAADWSKFGDAPACLYGEGYGAKIQKVGALYKPGGQDFVLFDVKVGDWWLEREDVEDVAEHFGLDVVPVVGDGTLADMERRVRDGFPSRWGIFQAEGIVARPAVTLRSRNGDRIITKLKRVDFREADHETD